ncbi:MAG: sulfate permease [Saprospiraceae bacterium]|nr:sulfate permease [Saprospiraceae bacterium]
MNGIIQQITHSDIKSIKSDLIAGLTVAVMLIPQGMAYAMLAGLPPIYGLYAGFIPLIVYPLFGSSKELSVGPVAVVSIIVLAGISPFATPGTTEFIQLAILTSLVAGIIQLILSFLKMGFLVNFLSNPVISGFTAAAALIIGLSQLKYLFGVELPRTSGVIGMIRDLIQSVDKVHLLSFVMGGIAVAFILLLKRIKKAFPASLVAIIIGTALVYAFNWNDLGVLIVENVPSSLPAVTFSFIDMDMVLKVLPVALIICLISFIESLAIAKTIAARKEDESIDANKELLGLGLSKVVGSFFQAFPNTGSFTRSAINNDAGAKTGLSSIFAGIFVGLTLLFLTPLFYFMPKPVLAAIVIAAVFGLIDIPYARNLFRFDRKDFYVFMATFLLTLFLGVQQGVFAGIILSVLMIVYESSRPHYAILGKLSGTNSFRSIERFPEATMDSEILVFRYDEDLYFGNAEHFHDSIMNSIEGHPKTRLLVLNASSINRIDSTGLAKFERMIHKLNKMDIIFKISGLRGEVRDLLVKTKVMDLIGLENNYLSIQDAINGFKKNDDSARLSREYASQSNKKIKI